MFISSFSPYILCHIIDRACYFPCAVYSSLFIRHVYLHCVKFYSKIYESYTGFYNNFLVQNNILIIAYDTHVLFCAVNIHFEFSACNFLIIYSMHSKSWATTTWSSGQWSVIFYTSFSVLKVRRGKNGRHQNPYQRPCVTENSLIAMLIFTLEHEFLRNSYCFYKCNADWRLIQHFEQLGHRDTTMCLIKVFPKTTTNNVSKVYTCWITVFLNPTQVTSYFGDVRENARTSCQFRLYIDSFYYRWLRSFTCIKKMLLAYNTL